MKNLFIATLTHEIRNFVAKYLYFFLLVVSQAVTNLWVVL